MSDQCSDTPPCELPIKSALVKFIDGRNSADCMRALEGRSSGGSPASGFLTCVADLLGGWNMGFMLNPPVPSTELIMIEGTVYDAQTLRVVGSVGPDGTRRRLRGEDGKVDVLYWNSTGWALLPWDEFGQCWDDVPDLPDAEECPERYVAYLAKSCGEEGHYCLFKSTGIPGLEDVGFLADLPLLAPPGDTYDITYPVGLIAPGDTPKSIVCTVQKLNGTKADIYVLDTYAWTDTQFTVKLSDIVPDGTYKLACIVWP